MQNIYIDVLSGIFNFLPFDERINVSTVSKKWTLAKDGIREQIEKITFRSEEWKRLFNGINSIDKEPPIPKHIISILEEKCPYFEQKRIIDTHIIIFLPKKINNKQCSITQLNNLNVEPLLSTYGLGYDNTEPYDRYNSESRWILTCIFLAACRGDKIGLSSCKCKYKKHDIVHIRPTIISFFL